MSEIYEIRMEIPAEHEKNISGHLDAYIKKLERSLGVSFVSRDREMHITGPAEQVSAAGHCVEELLAYSMRGHDITEQEINYLCATASAERRVPCWNWMMTVSAIP